VTVADAQPATPAETDASQVTGDAAFQAAVLEEMSSAVNYHRWLVDLAMPYLGDRPLEIGSGTGDYAQMWADGGVQVTASEGYPPLVARLRERFADNPSVHVKELVAPIRETADHSAVVAFNVLEHIPDDVDALRSFAGLVRPGGAVVLFVPAFEALMSDYDVTVGHQRRYRKRSLVKAMTDAGLDVERVRYVNVVGFFGWFVTMRLLRGRPGDSLLLRVFDRFFVPVLRRVESLVAPPFGQSLFVVGRRRGALAGDVGR
jgi:SAM-dependent methyltransferase